MNKHKKEKIINLRTGDDLEKVEEDILEAAKKTGSKNVIVNIFSMPGKMLGRRWRVRYKFNKKHLIFDAIIAAIILALIGLNVFWIYGGFNYFTDKLSLKFSVGFNRAVSGQSVTFDLNYENANKFKLEDAVLSIKLPKYFKLKKVSTENYDYQHNILKLGNLDSGANGKIVIDGQIIGELNEEQSVVANLTYYKTDKKGARLWGDFSKLESFKYKIDGSYLSVITNLPDRLIGGQVFDWQIKVKNESSDLTYKKVKLIYKKAEIYSSGDYSIENLAPNEEKTFNLPIKVSASQDFNPEISLIWEDGFSLTQNVISHKKQVANPNFSFVQKLQPEKAVSPGDWVDIKINYKNSGEYSLENVRLELSLIGDYWDLSSVEKVSGKQVGNKIVFDSSNIGRLLLVQPGEEGEFTVKVKVKDYVADTKDVLVFSRIDSYFKMENNEAYIDGNGFDLKLNSNLGAIAYPIYYLEGDQLGRGPIPPKVGTETSYWLFVKMRNSINEVKDVKVKLSLAPNVSWTEKSNVPVGNAVVFDESTRTMTWKISKLPAPAEGYGFALELGITPDSTQRGTYPNLISDLEISGVDSVTGEIITKQIGAITTKLSVDTEGAVKDGVTR